MISTQKLMRYPLFSGLSHYMLKEISIISNEIEVEKGAWLFYEGDRANRLFIVTKGFISLTTQIFLNGRSRDIEAADPVGPGELLGWSALVEPQEYSSSGRAKVKSRLIEIDVEPFRELLMDNPELGFLFMNHVAEAIRTRLDNKNVQLLSLVLDSLDEDE